jgi:hypothetical protein
MRRMIDSELDKVKRLLPEFIKAVEEAKKEQNTILVTTLDAFYLEPELLYLAIHYANENNISITFGA